MRRCLGSRPWHLPPANTLARPSCSRNLSRGVSSAVSSSTASGSATSTRRLELLALASPSLAQSREYQDLLYHFDQPSHLSSPNSTWEAYTTLLRANLQNSVFIPLPVHERALRRCIPYYTTVLAGPMTQKGKQSRAEASLSGWCPYQRRIDTILEQIYLVGSFPSLDNVHMILLHNALWGNVRGSVDLLSRLIEYGLTPTQRTYELVLYSLVRKLALVGEHWHSRRELVDLIAAEFYAVTDRMAQGGISQTRVIADHCTRILSAISSPSQFRESVIQLHGVDVSQPDVVPPHFIDQYLSLIAPFRSNTPNPDDILPPVSTATLNTLIRTLGSGSEPSLAAMVATFETLTAPIPPLRAKEEAYGYEDGADDDEPYYAPSLPGSIRRSQPAQPNTQTFTYLIQNCVRMKSKVLAKHYLSHAIVLEREQEQAIREGVRNVLFDPETGSMVVTQERLARLQSEIRRATVGVNVYMFKAIYRLADSTDDLALMIWLNEKERAVVEEKKKTVLLFKGVAEAMNAADLPVGQRQAEEPLPRVADAPLSPAFDLGHHLRVQTKTLNDIESQVGVVQDSLEAARTHIARTANAINRIRERKQRWLFKKVSASISDEEQDATKLRSQLYRQWAQALYLATLRKRTAETLNDVGRDTLAVFATSDPSSLTLAADEDSHDAASPELDELLTYGGDGEALRDARAAARSAPDVSLSGDRAELLPALDDPLLLDSRLHRYNMRRASRLQTRSARDADVRPTPAPVRQPDAPKKKKRGIPAWKRRPSPMPEPFVVRDTDDARPFKAMPALA